MASEPYSEATDGTLLTRHLSGDSEAFLVLVDRYGPVLTRVLRRGVHRPQDADELVQDTFLQLHRHARDFDTTRPLRPWLMTIAMNLKREYFRRKGRRPESELILDGRSDPATAPVDGLDQRDAKRRVALGMEGLTAAQRDVIELHWFGGLSMAEVAEAVGASLSAVKVRAHRGYAAMRSALSEEA